MLGQQRTPALEEYCQVRNGDLLLYIILLHMILLHVMCFAVDMQYGPSLGHHQYVCISWYRTGRITSDNNCTRKRRCKKGALIAVDDQGHDGDEDYCRFSSSFGQHCWVKHVSFRDMVRVRNLFVSTAPPQTVTGKAHLQFANLRL